MSRSNTDNHFAAVGTMSTLKILLLALILSVGSSYVFAANGNAPAANPPTCPLDIDACNGPIHSGTKDQTKTGGLSILGDLLVGKKIFVNDSLGVAIPVGTLPTANFDLAGTLKYRGNASDASNRPAPGMVLTAVDSSGNIKWKSPSGSNSDDKPMIKFGTASILKSCGGSTSACTADVVFPTPFPLGMVPIVTAQPKWARDNSDEHSSWRVTDVTLTGFKFTMSMPHDSLANGEDGLMWSAIADGTKFYNSTLSDASCRGRYGTRPAPGVTTQRITWLANAPRAYGKIYITDPVTGASRGGGIFNATGLEFDVEPEFPEPAINPPRTITKSYLVKDLRDTTGVVVTCSIALPMP